MKNRTINLYKILLMLVAGGGLCLSVVGCGNRRDVVRGAVVGGILGGVVGGITGYDDHPRYRHRRHYRRYASEQATNPFTASNAVNQEALQDVNAVRQNLNVSHTTAQIFVSQIYAAEVGDVDGLFTAGLSDEDHHRLLKLEMPSHQGIVSIANQLQTDTNKARQIVQKMVDEAKVQFANQDSLVWQTCIEAGTWKTPENASCEQTWWVGCSPATKASACIPAY